MGMDASVAFEIARSVRRWDLEGDVCTLGISFFRSSPEDLVRAIRSNALEPMAGDDPFMRMGFRSVESIDVSAFEGCTHVFDLNSSELPGHLRERFDLIYDGGTLEHVFDIRAALKNKFELLRVGGVIVDFLPINGWVDHGFYQFSPTFCADYYAANEFEILEARLMRYEPCREVVTVYPYVPGSLDAVLDGAFTGSWLYYSVARKRENTAGHRIPLQRRYAEIHGVPGKDFGSHLRFFMPYKIVRGEPLEIAFKKIRIDAWRQGEGHELLAHLPELALMADNAGTLSPLILIEDSCVIGPPHTSHDKIREIGNGAYSHWGESLHFSTSDNGAPDGRVYECAIPLDNNERRDSYLGSSPTRNESWFRRCVLGGMRLVTNRKTTR